MISVAERPARRLSIIAALRLYSALVRIISAILRLWLFTRRPWRSRTSIATSDGTTIWWEIQIEICPDLTAAPCIGFSVDLVLLRMLLFSTRILVFCAIVVGSLSSFLYVLSKRRFFIFFYMKNMENHSLGYWRLTDSPTFRLPQFSFFLLPLQQVA